MVVLKSNLFHLLFEIPQSLKKYYIQTQPKVESIIDFEQIIDYLRNQQQYLIDTQSGFYVKESWIHSTQYRIMLLKGQQVMINIVQDTERNEDQLIQRILNRLMINTKFLYCRHLQSCYNPFEERKIGEGSELPGFKLSFYKQSQMGIFIIPQLLIIQRHSQNMNSKVLIDTSTGKFYYKADIIKVDKQSDEIHFRDKTVLSKRNLKPVYVKPCIGYQLACALQNYYQRISMTSPELLKFWNLSISPRSQDMQVAFVDPGFINMKGVNKSLNNMIFPVAKNAYNEYYRQNFDGTFQQFPDLQIYLCYKQINPKVRILMNVLQNIRERMGLNLTIYKAENWNVAHFIPRPDAIYLIFSNDTLALEKKAFLQTLISSQAIYHIIDQSDIIQDNNNLNEVTVLQNLSIICTKFRKAPWKLKDIPFCNQPLSVVSLSIENDTNKSDHCSIAMTYSLNSFLSKFMSLINEITSNLIPQTVEHMLQTCIMKFNQCHKRLPSRLVMFVSGSSVPQNLYQNLKSKLSYFYTAHNKTLDFVLVSHRPIPSLRIYNMKTNLLNPETVKPTGLLSCLVFQNKLCLQLLMFSSLTQFSISHDSNDPDFLKKMSELIVKLAFGSVDNHFGGGLGFLSFAKKLNKYKELDLKSWTTMLADGYMLYL